MSRHWWIGGLLLMTVYHAPMPSLYAAVAYLTTTILRQTSLVHMTCISALNCSWAFYGLAQIQHVPTSYAWYCNWQVSNALFVVFFCDAIGDFLISIREDQAFINVLAHIIQQLNDIKELWENKVSEDDLPPLQYGKRHVGFAECAICQDEFARKELHRVLPCEHAFHAACVDPWLIHRSPTCPLCRQQAYVKRK